MAQIGFWIEITLYFLFARFFATLFASFTLSVRFYNIKMFSGLVLSFFYFLKAISHSFNTSTFQNLTITVLFTNPWILSLRGIVNNTVRRA